MGDMELFMSKESLDAVKAKPAYERIKSTFKHGKLLVPPGGTNIFP